MKEHTLQACIIHIYTSFVTTSSSAVVVIVVVTDVRLCFLTSSCLSVYPWCVPPPPPPRVGVQAEVREVMQALEELAVSYDVKDKEIERSVSAKLLLEDEVNKLQVGVVNQNGGRSQYSSCVGS